MTVRAAVLNRVQALFSIETLELDPPRVGEVLIKMAAAGVCHSDWHLVTGATPHPLPVVAGHEGSGVVVSVGPGVTRVQPGDHVTLNWAPSCGNCYYCDRDRPGLCETYNSAIWAGTMLDGTTRLSRAGSPVFHFSALACFAEHVVTPETCCVKMDSALPLEIAALIGCAVATGFGAVMNTAKIERGSSVLVAGAGGVGLSSVLAAAAAGAKTLIVLDKSLAKRTLCFEYGATHALAPTENWVQEVRDLTGGRGVDYAFEAVGNVALQEACLDAIRPGGVLVLAGISPADQPMKALGAGLTRNEKSILGCYYGGCNPERDFPMLGARHLSGEIDLRRLISKTYPLEMINAAYAQMLTGDSARGLIVFE